MSLHYLYSLIQDDLNALDSVITQELQEDIPFINSLCKHIIEGGGKRLRPLTVLLGAKAFSYQEDIHIKLAASMEFFHTATLLHDDVVDSSTLRRGKPTVNDIWGSKASVLIGDFLFTRAFQLLVVANNVDIITLLANTANTITKGEVLQLINCHDANTSEQQYMKVIEYKTAVLFSAAAQLGALLTRCSSHLVQAMGQYGLHLGNAFQLVDDALDYCSDAETIGKNAKNDLAEGTPTLPLIYALHHGNTTQQAIIRNAIENNNDEKPDVILETIHTTKAIEYTYTIAQQEIDYALTALQEIPKTIYRDALEKLAVFAIERDH